MTDDVSWPEYQELLAGHQALLEDHQKLLKDYSQLESDRQATIDVAHRRIAAYRAGTDQVLADVRAMRRRMCSQCRIATSDLGPLMIEGKVP